MKNKFIFLFIVIAFCVGFLAARWSQPQPADMKSGIEQTTNEVALQQLASLITYLQDTKQTNALKNLNNATFYSEALHHYGDLMITASILKIWREGQTNELSTFLEDHLDAEIVEFGYFYSDLPAPVREQMSLKGLKFARDYRAKYPFKSDNQNYDEEVSNTFKILDETSAK